MKKWQHARFELDFELGFGLDIILKRRADKYPTAFPCIDKQRRVQFLITSTRNPPSRLHLGPIHLALSGSNPKHSPKSSPKLKSWIRLIKNWQVASFGLGFGLEPESGRWSGPK